MCDSFKAIGDGLPEWMSESEDSSAPGPVATMCMLRWAMQNALRNTKGNSADAAFSTADRLRRLESQSSWSLDDGAVIEFFTKLDDEAQKSVFAGLERGTNAEHWARALNRTQGAWFKVRQELSRRWSPNRHLDLCRQSIAADWRYALPVLEDIAARRAFAEGEIIVNEAVASLLRPTSRERIDLETTLLIGHGAMRWTRPEDFGKGLVHLLELGATIAGGAGQTNRRVALELQATALENWQNWDTMLEQFARAECDGHAELTQSMFLEWRHLVEEICCQDIGVFGKGSRKNSFRLFGVKLTLPTGLTF
jgi:hypothetical protein